jgi:DNA polymerase-3 subunit epsilon
MPSGRPAVLGGTPFAVVDLETTGVYPGGHDRIVEIAVVRLRPDLQLEEEWVTLVNPARDIGRTDIHGIRAGDVADAPRFDEIAADVAARLRDAVLVGHHLRFDRGFLASEFARLGVALPDLPGLCTLDLAYRLLPDAPSRKLAMCCEEVGVLHEDEHTALGDARATAGLLTALIERARRVGARDLTALGCEPSHLPGSWGVSRAPSGRRLTRAGGAIRRSEERAYLARLVERMLGDEGRNAREGEYLALVDRALEDRRVTQDEAVRLMELAASWGMTRSDVLEAHRAYLATLVTEALADGSVSDAERSDLEDVRDLLGLHRAALTSLLEAPPVGPRSIAPAPATTVRSPGGLRGKTVCFTGEITSMLDGERITRELAEKLATEAGLEVRQSVTKRLDVLIVADPDTQSGKARKAREYGVRIMAEGVFWRALGVRTDGTE